MRLAGKSCASIDEPIIGMVQPHCNALYWIERSKARNIGKEAKEQGFATR
jgi:hypothetical protein